MSKSIESNACTTAEVVRPLTQIDLALHKMRKNIVPGLSMSVVAEHYDRQVMRVRKRDEELERIRDQRDVLADACQSVRNAYQQMFNEMPVAFQTFDNICEAALANAGLRTKPEPTGEPLKSRPDPSKQWQAVVYGRIGNEICRISKWTRYTDAQEDAPDPLNRYTLFPIGGGRPHCGLREGEFTRYSEEENQAVRKMLAETAKPEEYEPVWKD